MRKIYIDGKEGTTGLRIYERLGIRDDIEIVSLTGELRKDSQARKEMLNSCDFAFLCLPDAAARDAVSMTVNPDVTIIDASTAHRTNPEFAYGFPELSTAHRDKLNSSRRIAVPGCHASGFVALVYPLVSAGILDPGKVLSCQSVSGYSGGGNKMIRQYQDPERDGMFDAPCQYALGQGHKHLPEMRSVCGLVNDPLFCPMVADFYSGMVCTVPIFAKDLNRGGVDDIRRIYRETYNTSIVSFSESISENGFISASGMSGKDGMEITVEGNDERILLIARYDNLGKGASGAAVQCLNIILGVEETKGLEL